MNQSTTRLPAVSTDLAVACSNAAEFVLLLAQSFLVLALLVAVLETGLALWAKLQAARKGPQVAGNALEAVPAVDPVKLLDALKGLLETLKSLPAWIAIFLAGTLLFWVAVELSSDRCAPAPGGARPPTKAEQPAPRTPVANQTAPRS